MTAAIILGLASLFFAVNPAVAQNDAKDGGHRGAHVQSAAGPCIGVSPYSGLYVISPKKIGTILINGLV